MLATEKGSCKLKHFSEDFQRNYNDGRRIFVNRLRFYHERAIEEHMLSFKQLMYKDLGIKDRDLKGKSGIRAAIMSTMVFDMEMVMPLVEE